MNVLTRVAKSAIRQKKFYFVDLWDLNGGTITVSLLQDCETGEYYVNADYTWYKSESGKTNDINKSLAMSQR